MTVSAYTNNLQPATFDPYVRNVELIASTLLNKQHLYDETYKGIQGLKQQALSINFLNKGQQSKIDNYNTEINDYFSKVGNEFGDLTDSKVATQITSMFDKIGNDISLINNYRQDKEYQDMLTDVNKMKNSKDPAKAGYHPINYSNFLNRVQEYSDMDLNDPSNSGFRLTPYTNFTDTGKETALLSKNVPVKKFEEEKILNNGYKQVIRREGKDPVQMQGILQEYYTGVGLPQLKEEAEYIYNNIKNNPDEKENLYSRYKSDLNERIKDLNDKRVKATLDVKEGKDVESNTLQLAKIEQELADLNAGPDNFNDFFNRPPQQIISDIAGQHLHDSIKNQTQALSGYATTVKYEPDQTYLKFLDLKAKAEQFNANFELDKANLQEKHRHNLATENKESNSSNSNSKSGSGNDTGSGNPGDATFSTEDPSTVQPFSVHSEYSLDKLNEILKKGYSSQINIFKEGLSGKDGVDAETLGYKMMKNPKYLDGNPYFNSSPYLKAYKLIVDNIRGNNSEYLSIMNMDAKTDDDWNKKKYVMKYINDEVERVIKEPKTKREVEISNQAQDVNAQMQSLGDFMDKVNKSGNPEEFIKNYPAFNVMLMGKINLDVKDKTGEDKAAIVSRRDDIASSLHEVLGTNIAGTDQIVDIPKQAMTYAQRAFDGTVRVWLKPELFEGATIKEFDEEGQEIKVTVPKLRGNYFVINNKKIPLDLVKSQKYIEFKDAKYATADPLTQIGLMVSQTPQTRYGWGEKTKQSVPYTIRLSDEDGLIHFKIGDGPDTPFVSSNSKDAINAIQKVIQENY